MEILTERLCLREFRSSDFEAVRAFDADPLAQKYEKGPLSDEQVRANLARAEAWAREQPRQHYLLAVTVRPQDQVRGRISLAVHIAEIHEWEIGWIIHPDDWGRGFAPEAARAALDLAFRQLQAHRVVAFCHAGNAASIRVMEKIGMHRDGYLRETRWWNDGWSDEYLGSILEQEWPPGPNPGRQ